MIELANQEFGNETLYTESSQLPQDTNSSNTTSVSIQTSLPAPDNGPDNESSPADSAYQVPHTVNGGVCIFDALYDLSQVHCDSDNLDWFQVNQPAGLQFNSESGNFLLGYSKTEVPVFEYSHKKVLRNVATQVRPQQRSVSTQNDLPSPAPPTPELPADQFGAAPPICPPDAGAEDDVTQEEFFAANRELKK